MVSFNTPANEAIESIVLHAPNHINSLPHFLVEYQTLAGHSAEVFHVDLKKNAVSKAYSLPELRSKGTFTTSTSDANVYFTRITEDQATVYSSVSHGKLGQWTLKSSLETAGAYPVHGVSEVVVKAGTASAVRSAVLYSNGQWVLLRNDEIAWTRPEFLSRTAAAVWARLPAEEALAQALEDESHRNVVSAYLHRLQRHIGDLQHFPAWAQNLPGRLLGSVFGKTKETTVEDIQQDTFGFHKLVVVATEGGRLAALDVGSRGKVMWNIDLHQFAPESTFSNPSMKAHGGYVEIKDSSLTIPILVNTTTGGLVKEHTVIQHSGDLAVPGQEIVSYTLVDGVLEGYLENHPGSEPVWNFVPANGEHIVAYSARPLIDPVASIGTVLGDRRVLYKYLNPNLVLVTAIADSASTASFYLLDAASGQLLHSSSHYDVDTSRPISSAVSENFFAYSFTTDGKSGSESRGYQLVVSDLYESPLPDDRGPLGANSNSSNLQPSGSTGEIKPYVLSQSYNIPGEIEHMTVTQTRQGITSRELLVTVPSTNSIIGIPRRILDPRRPIGRDPSAQEQAEGLTRYVPSILWNPQWHLTHKYEVIGIKDVITSQSGIESTSLVFAYGLDIFGTRVAPSFAFDILGKGFNKISMLITVVGLFGGVLFVAPLVSQIMTKSVKLS